MKRLNFSFKTRSDSALTFKDREDFFHIKATNWGHILAQICYIIMKTHYVPLQTNDNEEFNGASFLLNVCIVVIR